MRTFVVAVGLTLTAGPAPAQTQPTDSFGSRTLPTERSSTATEAIDPSYNSPNVPLPDYEAPDLNGNSPNEDQAKSQIEAKGYLDVSGLQKDDRGIWQGAATLKDGRSVTVILDLQGNIYSKLPIAADQ